MGLLICWVHKLRLETKAPLMAGLFFICHLPLVYLSSSPSLANSTVCRRADNNSRLLLYILGKWHCTQGIDTSSLFSHRLELRAPAMPWRIVCTMIRCSILIPFYFPDCDNQTTTVYYHILPIPGLLYAGKDILTRRAILPRDGGAGYGWFRFILRHWSFSLSSSSIIQI